MVDTTEALVAPAASTAAPVADTAAPITDAAASTPPAPAASVETTAPVAADTAAKPADVVTSTTGSTEHAKAETPTPPVTESVLGDTKTPEAAKPATPEAGEKKADTKADEKPTDAKGEKPTETKVELPVYDEFKVPEGVTLEKEPLSAFTKILGEIETGKLDHAGIQAKGQELIDLATKSTVESINRLNDYYVQYHENQKKEWFEASKKDPDLGNGNEDTFGGIASNLRTAIDEYAGNATQQAEFRQLMKETSVGNHPAMLRMLNNMDAKIKKYTTEGDGNRMVTGVKPAPTKVKPYQMFYQGNNA